MAQFLKITDEERYYFKGYYTSYDNGAKLISNNKTAISKAIKIKQNDKIRITFDVSVNDDVYFLFSKTDDLIIFEDNKAIINPDYNETVGRSKVKAGIVNDIIIVENQNNYKNINIKRTKDININQSIIDDGYKYCYLLSYIPEQNYKISNISLYSSGSYIKRNKIVELSNDELNYYKNVLYLYWQLTYTYVLPYFPNVNISKAIPLYENDTIIIGFNKKWLDECKKLYPQFTWDTLNKIRFHFSNSTNLYSINNDKVEISADTSTIKRFYATPVKTDGSLQSYGSELNKYLLEKNYNNFNYNNFVIYNRTINQSLINQVGTEPIYVYAPNWAPNDLIITNEDRKQIGVYVIRGDEIIDFDENNLNTENAIAFKHYLYQSHKKKERK